MTTTRDEFIADAAARYATIPDETPTPARCVTSATVLADALEAAGCAPWAAKAKRALATIVGFCDSWAVRIGTLCTPWFPSKESAAAFAAAINGEDAT